MSHAKPTPLRKQQTNYTRQRLIDAARELFVRHGTRGTSVDDIAREAGTSRATFYAHFTDKQDVIRELLRSMWETAFDLYETFGELEDWSHASIGAWLRQVFEAWERHAESTKLVIREMPSEIQADFLTNLTKRTDALMSARAMWSRFDPEEGERRACLLLFQLERSMAARHFGGWPGNREALLKTMTDIWVATLNPQPDRR